MLKPGAKKKPKIEPIPRQYLVDRRLYLKKPASQMASELGIRVAYYNQLESGKAGRNLSVLQLMKLAEALELTITEVVHAEADYLGRIVEKENEKA